MLDVVANNLSKDVVQSIIPSTLNRRAPTSSGFIASQLAPRESKFLQPLHLAVMLHVALKCFLEEVPGGRG